MNTHTWVIPQQASIRPPGGSDILSGSNLRFWRCLLSLDHYTNMIYFPTPDDGFEGLHTLTLEGMDVELPIEVKFWFPVK